MRPAISDRGYTENVESAVFSALRDWRKLRIEKYGEALRIVVLAVLHVRRNSADWKKRR